MIVNFEVKQTFKITTKNIFVLCGYLVTGEIRKGMRVYVDENTFYIQSIEFLDSKNRKSMLGLVLIYNNSNELKVLEKFFFTESLIQII